jgi:hypothetical protein
MIFAFGLVNALMINSLALTYQSAVYHNLNSLSPKLGLDFFLYFLTNHIHHPIIFSGILLLDLSLLSRLVLWSLRSLNRLSQSNQADSSSHASEI